MYKKIEIKNTKTIEEYIKVNSNIDDTQRCYSYVKIDSTHPALSTDKHTFNKYAFVEYLKNRGISKKIIKEVEML